MSSSSSSVRSGHSTPDGVRSQIDVSNGSGFGIGDRQGSGPFPPVGGDDRRRSGANPFIAGGGGGVGNEAGTVGAGGVGGAGAAGAGVVVGGGAAGAATVGGAGA